MKPFQPKLCASSRASFDALGDAPQPHDKEYKNMKSTTAQTVAIIHHSDNSYPNYGQTKSVSIMQHLKEKELRAYYEAILGEEPGEKTVALDSNRTPRFMLDYIAEAQKTSNAMPGALVTAWLPHIAVNIGERVYIPSGGCKHFCKLWTVLVGPSAISGKSTCLNLARKTMEPYLEAIQDLPDNDYQTKHPVISNTTQAKLMDLLSKNPNRLWVLDEFAVLIRNNSQLFNAGLIENITSLYDGGSINISNMDRYTRIIDPALSIAGATVPSVIASAFASTANQAAGFLQRILFCFMGYDVDYQFTDNATPDYTTLRQFDEIFSVFRRIPGSFAIHISDEHNSKRNAILEDVLNSAKEERNDRLSEYSVRVYRPVFHALIIIITLMKEYAALDKAISSEACEEFFQNLVVSNETFEEALYLCSYYMENAKPLLKCLTDQAIWQEEMKVIRFLLRSPDFTASHSQVMRSLHFNAKTMKNVMGNLIDKNYVSAEIIPSDGFRPVQIYSLVDPQDV